MVDDTDKSWVEKHRPQTFDDVQGNNTALKQIRKWADNWSPGDNPILLYGAPGTGKTTTAYLIADLMDAPLNQINASSARTTDDIKRIADEMDTSGVDSDYQVVFLDEIDSWHHTVSPEPIEEKLKSPRNPVVMAANEKYEVPYGLKNKRHVDVYEFKLNVRSRRAKLKEIAEREGVDLTDEQLSQLADRGDLRSAINDLQLFAEVGEIPDDQRDVGANPWEIINGMMQADTEPARNSAKDVDPPLILHLMDENLAKDFRGLEAGVAYDALSRADIQLGRVRGNDYRGWKFAAELMYLAPHTRLSEPSKPHWIDTGWPTWFQSKKPANEHPKEYRLFQALKDADGGSFQFAGSFAYFRSTVLPMLKSADDEELYDLALNHGLDDDEVEALGIDPDDFTDWVEQEAPEAGEWEPPTADVLEW